MNSRAKSPSTRSTEHNLSSTRSVSPGPQERTVRTSDGTVLTIPVDWQLLPPGDAALTRRVKAAGEHYVVQEKRGRKTFSLGVWAAAKTIEQFRAALSTERENPAYARKRAADARRREVAQTQYVEDFAGAVEQFLAFDSRYAAQAKLFAQAVASHATPVGSGTVARTQRIPIAARAEAAVIAWMRHQTTGYDSMKIARVRGKRREVRAALAGRSHELLTMYRRGYDVPANCPLKNALDRLLPPASNATSE